MILQHGRQGRGDEITLSLNPLPYKLGFKLTAKERKPFGDDGYGKRAEQTEPRQSEAQHQLYRASINRVFGRGVNGRSFFLVVFCLGNALRFLSNPIYLSQTRV